MKQARIAFIDIESAPTLAWAFSRFKTNIGLDHVVHDGYIMCVCWKWIGESDVGAVRSMKSGWLKTDDKDSAIAAWKVLDEADVVVAHNAKGFDIPMLNAAFVRHGLPPPSPYKVVDTLDVAKRTFKFPSNKLEGLCRFFGFGHKNKTDFSLWTRCIEGDEIAWTRMLNYCKNDVRKLERVYKRLLPYMPGHPNVALFDDSGRPACPKCGSHHIQWRGKKVYRTSSQIYQAYQCQSCGGWARGLRSALAPDRRKTLLVSAGQ
jgi:uncharacterized protein YprB with RNaseH-like and TPR domain/predicted RNA-binding Zn-ribbon protein involved in translation (DUF1610 family)